MPQLPAFFTDREKTEPVGVHGFALHHVLYSAEALGDLGDFLCGIDILYLIREHFLQAWIRWVSGGIRRAFSAVETKPKGSLFRMTQRR